MVAAVNLRRDEYVSGPWPVNGNGQWPRLGAK